MINKKTIWGIAIVIIAIFTLAMSSMLFTDVKVGETVVNQQPITGNISVWAEPGIKLRLFGDNKYYQKAVVHYFSALKTEGNSEDTSIAIKFNDGSIGSVSGTAMIKLPTNEKQMTLIQEEAGSMQGVIEKIITPKLNEVIYMSGGFLSPFEAYNEKRSDLIEYITDQLTYGIYKTKSTEIIQRDSTSGETKRIKFAERIENPNAPGGYERSSKATFDYFGLDVKLSISDVKFSKEVNDQIAQQQQSQMSINTAVIEAKAAQQRVLKEEAEGKAIAEKAKWEQEKIKIVAVTKAQQEFEVAELEAKKAKENAKKILEEGRAEAEANRLKVAAGLTPLEKATIDKETAIGIAEAIAQSKQPITPEIVIIGGEKGSVNPMDLFGVKMAQDIVTNMNKK